MVEINLLPTSSLCLYLLERSSASLNRCPCQQPFLWSPIHQISLELVYKLFLWTGTADVL